MEIKPPSPDNIPQNPLPPTKKSHVPAAQQELHEFVVEQFQPWQSHKLQKSWQKHPDVRPEVLNTAKAIAKDPNYPAPAQLAFLAKMIMGREAPPNIEPPVPAPTPDIEPPVS